MIPSTHRNCHIKKIGTDDEFLSLKENWNALLDESSYDSYFLRWEWLWNWWLAYKEANFKLQILLVIKNDILVGIGPFYIAEVSWKNIFKFNRLMFLGTKEGSVISEYMDVICSRGNEELVIQNLLSFIVHDGLCHDLSLQKIDAASKTGSLLRRFSDNHHFLYLVQNVFEVPYSNLPSNVEELLSTFSISMRNKIKKDQKIL